MEASLPVDEARERMARDRPLTRIPEASPLPDDGSVGRGSAEDEEVAAKAGGDLGPVGDDDIEAARSRREIPPRSTRRCRRRPRAAFRKGSLLSHEEDREGAAAAHREEVRAARRRRASASLARDPQGVGAFLDAAGPVEARSAPSRRCVQVERGQLLLVPRQARASLAWSQASRSRG